MKNQAAHYDAKKSRLNLLLDVWEYKIIPLLHVTELAVLRRTCAWFERHWQEFLARNQIRVPQDLPTIEKAMFFASILSEQKNFTKDSPLVVLLSEGEHSVDGNMTDEDGQVHETVMEITCANISFIGQGSNKTTVCGGFGVGNKKNVTLKNLTLTNPTTNPNGYGLHVEGEEASVEMRDVSVKECENGVMLCGRSKGTFINCSFHHNEIGVYAQDQGTLVKLRGEETKIHHNNFGVYAYSNATIKICIPSQLITALVHDNSSRDFLTYNFGTMY